MFIVCHHVRDSERIGSMTAANAEQCAGFMICGVLDRVVLGAFPTYGAGDPDDDVTDESYRLLLKKKIWRITHSLTAEDVSTRILINWLAVYLDHLWMEVQHFDAVGNLMMSLVKRTASNPFMAVIQKYTLLISQPISESHLKTLFHHFAGEDIDVGFDDGMDAVVDQCRLMSASLACQITWRCLWKFEDMPHALLLMVHPASTPEEQQTFAQEFMKIPRCELDPDFSLKVFVFIYFLDLVNGVGE